MIESTLGRIADALEAIATRMESGTAPADREPPQATKDDVETKRVEVPTPEEVAPEPKVQPTEITLDALRKSLAPLDPTAGRALLEKFGVKKVSELQPEQYMDVLKAAKAAK